MPRLHNFSAGPCTLPLPVLEQVRDQLIDYRGHGMSLVEMSHRTPPVQDVRDRAVAAVRRLLALPDGYHVCFLGGGATQQFGMAPLNLLHGGHTSADYTHSGAWAKKAIADARLVADPRGGDIRLAYDGTPNDYTTLPDPAAVTCRDDAAYLHLTSNETIGGVQWKSFPRVAPPIVADMSSDILSRPLPMEPFGLIYAGAQKNIGAAGVTLVIIRDDVLARCDGALPMSLRYAAHVEGDSMANTPPVFQLWVVALVLEWLEAQGGVAWAQRAAAARSGALYDAIARSEGFYRCPVDPAVRSTMNVVFRLPSEDLEQRFIADADAAGLSGLKGHRSVGGCRASLYNAMTQAGAEALAGFMDAFADAHR